MIKEVATTSSTPEKFKTVQFESYLSKLKGLKLNGNSQSVINVKLNLLTFETNKKFAFDLIMRSDNGQIVGSHTFNIEPPTLVWRPNSIDVNTMDDGTILLNSVDRNTNNIYWIDQNGKNISTDFSISVMPSKGYTDFTLLSEQETGEYLADKVSLSFLKGIEKVEVDYSGTSLNITLKEQSLGECEIELIGTSDSNIYSTYKISKETKNYSVDISALKNGIYVLNYLESGKIVDSVKFIKK